jgi:hypothetical protein
MRIRFAKLLLMGIAACTLACRRSADNVSDVYDAFPDFGSAAEAVVQGYNGHIMEPFITRDGQRLYFNNLNSQPENTNLHWATRTGEGVFQYQGLLRGVNTPALDAVPSVDGCNRFYFISTRSYFQNLRTIYVGTLMQDSVAGVRSLAGSVVPAAAGTLMFDAEITHDCNLLYYSPGLFAGGSVPTSADIQIAQRVNDTTFAALPASAAVLQNVNSTALEYAPCLSVDQRELYFTRLGTMPGSVPQIYRTARATQGEPFAAPRLVAAATGFVEAATITGDGRTLYFHKLVNGQYRLYYAKR